MDGVDKNCNFLSSFSAMTALQASLTPCKKPRGVQWRKVNALTDGRTDSSHQFNPQSVTQQLVHVPTRREPSVHHHRRQWQRRAFGRWRYIHFECGNNGEKSRVTLQSQRSALYNENNAATKTRKGVAHVRRRDYSTDSPS